MVDLYERLIRGRTYLIPAREEKAVTLKKVRPKGK
jgi:hypothetical protein